MKNLWKCISGFCAVMALGVTGAYAQTVMNGPYYAIPSWDQTLPAATRFVVLSNFNNEGVLDRETGLVWERSPGTSASFSWLTASYTCMTATHGNRQGWKLPTIQELQSLVDKSGTPVRLPAGHPFTTVEGAYWSATIYAGNEDRAWITSFSNGGSGGFTGHTSKSDPAPFTWCVPGGQAVAVQ